ncbi:MAG: hypothetical protein LBF04_04020 [Prevotellaceae bacterium]|jgi:hypothetical protein|nr:hypothetical protein [Prevotellaceae bacterium]
MTEAYKILERCKSSKNDNDGFDCCGKHETAFDNASQYCGKHEKGLDETFGNIRKYEIIPMFSATFSNNENVREKYKQINNSTKKVLLQCKFIMTI